MIPYDSEKQLFKQYYIKFQNKLHMPPISINFYIFYSILKKNLVILKKQNISSQQIDSLNQIFIILKNIKYKIQIQKQIIKTDFKEMLNQQKNQLPNRITILNQQTIVFPSSNDEGLYSTMKDSLISLQFRIKTLEQQINSKMQRQECFTLMQRKSNKDYVRKCLDELYNKIEGDRVKDYSNLLKLQQQQKQKINQLKKKLKQVNCIRQCTQLTSTLAKESSLYNFTQNITKKIDKVLVKPQQLYLQSNQTMFSMIIDQIKQLRQQDSLIQRLIQSKHKKTVSLNNEVCRKLDFLESQLEETIRYIDNTQSLKVQSQSSEQKKPYKKSSSKTQLPFGHYSMQKLQTTANNPQSQAFQMIRLELLSKSMQSMQKQLSHKLNIKDIIPLIKQNLPSFQQNINEIKSYIEQNFESMRRILTNQSQINEQISKANKLAWWHCYEKMQIQQTQRSQSDDQMGYILFNKEIMNIIPECLVVEEGQQNVLRIVSKGWYFVHVYELSVDEEGGSKTSRESQNIWIEINDGARQPIRKTKLLNLPPNSSIKIITQKEDLFVQVQKL